MRLKEDSSSWKSNAIKKRDFKHDHSEPAPKVLSKKDKRKWCKGKVGIEHDYQEKTLRWVLNLHARLHVCTRCGRQNWRTYTVIREEK